MNAEPLMAVPGEIFPADERRIPSIWHALLFFVVALPLMVAGQYLAILAAQRLHLFGTKPMAAYLELAGADARIGVPTQAFAYVVVIAAVALVFRWLWGKSLFQGLEWQAGAAYQRAGWLAATGFLCGIGNGVIGNFLPMPKDPPIMADMMHSPAGAWMMLVFGVTLAPALEEMAFRGFLLPGFVHAFDWLEWKGDISHTVRNLVGLPVSVLLTSLPFALMHAPQVSHAWAPLVLIGLVSVVLCVVRLSLRSLAASTMVHSAYNLTLFLGLLVETDGFRHLDKLN